MNANNGNPPMVINEDDLSITASRIFDAPRDLVWKVYTDPAYVPQWWGQRGSTITVVQMDLRVGGEWRFIEHSADGNEHPFHGVYKEVQAPERLTYTFEYEPYAGHITTDTLTFEALPDGKTKIHAVTAFNSLSDLRGMVASGMEEGANESWDRLAEVLEREKSLG